MPCPSDNWHELKTMAGCQTCKACLNNCPTRAITAQSHLVNTDRCLTHFNEHDGTGFPAWINPGAHDSLVGCLRCQACCPVNQEFLNEVIEPAARFSEEETLILLENKPFEQLPAELARKLELLAIPVYYGALARNLKALLELK